MWGNKNYRIFVSHQKKKDMVLDQHALIELEAMQSTYKMMIESAISEKAEAPTVTLERFWELERVKFEAKLSVIEEVLEIIKK